MQKYSSKSVEVIESQADPELPRKPLTPAENVFLTIKILLIAGAIIGALWAFTRFSM
jgi:hypothetical protein